MVAERNSSIGARVALFGGLTNFSSVKSTDRPDLNWKERLIYGAVYPSVQFKSEGAHSALELNYTFGLNRMKTDRDFDWKSHTAFAGFSTSLSRWRVNLTESFDFTDFTFNSLQGGAVTPLEDFRFLYAPLAERRSSLTNTASGTAEYEITEKSTVSFNVSHALRRYDDGLLSHGGLSDQYRVYANVTYTRKTSAHSSWGLGYAAGFYGFKAFANAGSQAVNAVYSHSFSPTLTVHITAGPSHVQTLGKLFLGYNTSASLQKVVRSNTFTLHYARSNGDTSGYGSVSSIWQAGAGVHRRLGSRTSVLGDLSVFDTRSKYGYHYQMRGASAVASFGFDLNRAWSVNWGGEYHRYDQGSSLGFSQTGIFFSLNFSPPAWRLPR